MILDWLHSGHNQSDTHSGCIWLIIEPHGGQRPGPVNEGLLTACKSALVEASELAASELRTPRELTFTLLSKVLYPSKWCQAQSASVGMMVSSTQASGCFRKADFERIIFPSVTMSDDP